MRVSNRFHVALHVPAPLNLWVNDVSCVGLWVGSCGTTGALPAYEGMSWRGDEGRLGGSAIFAAWSVAAPILFSMPTYTYVSDRTSSFGEVHPGRMALARSAPLLEASFVHNAI
jgi:hypothetical protein